MCDDWGSGERPGQVQGPHAVSEAFDLLRSSRRRYTLAYLDDADGFVDLYDIAQYVHACERRGEGTDRSRSSIQDVYEDLYHAHVPRLCRDGVTTYEESADAVRLEALPEPVAACLDLARKFGDGDLGQ